MAPLFVHLCVRLIINLTLSLSLWLSSCYCVPLGIHTELSLSHTHVFPSLGLRLTPAWNQFLRLHPPTTLWAPTFSHHKVRLVLCQPENEHTAPLNFVLPSQNPLGLCLYSTHCCSSRHPISLPSPIAASGTRIYLLCTIKKCDFYFILFFHQIFRTGLSASAFSPWLHLPWTFLEYLYNTEKTGVPAYRSLNLLAQHLSEQDRA